MRILLITSPEEDYLQDTVIHGFKKLLGKDAVEFPTKHMLYNDYENINKIRGNGFTIYGLLNSELKPDPKLNIGNEILENKFDLIIFTSIFRQYKLFYKLYSLIYKQKKKVIIMDGEDTEVIFPYQIRFLKKYFFSPKPHKMFLYFKRELTGKSINSIYYKILANIFPLSLISPKNINKISFSIPEEKIIINLPKKTKLFASHIVDKEVSQEIYSGKTDYVFNTESEYYKDIQCSKFGITTKRAGWDCLRHYEIAANGAVICFKNLEDKPITCAPHGLIDGINCISYNNYENLTKKINSLSDHAYGELQNNSLLWVKQFATIEQAKYLINQSKNAENI